VHVVRAVDLAIGRLRSLRLISVAFTTNRRRVVSAIGAGTFRRRAAQSWRPQMRKPGLNDRVSSRHRANPKQELPRFLQIGIDDQKRSMNVSTIHSFFRRSSSMIRSNIDALRCWPQHSQSHLRDLPNSRQPPQ